ncbi:MAG: T9SS type A sorting domain-containing protein [Crocinitomicaceae bacterium]|nr:T9SS type A sorting domain-containing protein [Crocinitomicaceae bacterium]
MSNSTNNKKNLGKYTAIAGAFLASGAVNAQIQYTDVDPDQVVDMNNSPFNLDMDGDAVNDVIFNVGVVSGSGTYGGGLVNYFYSGNVASASAPAGGVVGSVSSQASMYIASGLSSGSAINSSANFLSFGILAGDIDVVLTGIYSTTLNQTPGGFVGQTDKFLGVTFDISGSTHYGWIRLDATDTQITIKDYAYVVNADVEILAGQTVGLDDVDISQKVSFKTLVDHAVINVTPDLIGGAITITDMQGREVSSTDIEDLNTTVDYSNVNSGIYMIAVQAKSGIVSKKVYIR